MVLNFHNLFVINKMFLSIYVCITILLIVKDLLTINMRECDFAETLIKNDIISILFGIMIKRNTEDNHFLV